MCYSFPSHFKVSNLNLLPLFDFCVSAGPFTPCGILPFVPSVGSPSAKQVSLLRHKSQSQCEEASSPILGRSTVSDVIVNAFASNGRKPPLPCLPSGGMFLFPLRYGPCGSFPPSLPPPLPHPIILLSIHLTSYEEPCQSPSLLCVQSICKS